MSFLNARMARRSPATAKRIIRRPWTQRTSTKHRRVSRRAWSACACWSDDAQRWEVGAVARGVAGQKRQTVHRRMRADIKVGKRRAPDAAEAAVARKALAGEESRLPGKREPMKDDGRQHIVEGFDPVEADRHLGVDDGVDCEGSLAGGPG